MTLDSSTFEAVETPVEIHTETVAEPVAEPAVEPVVEPVEEVKADEIPASPTEETTEEVAEVKEGTEEVKAAEEPIVFDKDADLPSTLEKVTQVLDKYEIPAEVQAAFDALKAKTEAAAVPEIVNQLMDYGDESKDIAKTVENIKESLDLAGKLTSVTIEDNGNLRPKTNEFVADLIARDAKAKTDTAQWLYYDIASSPSTQYKGITKFEEGIVNAVGVEGDTVGQTLDLYHKAIAMMKGAAIVPDSDIPKFIPAEVQQAFRSLPRETREEIAALGEDVEGYDFSADRNRKVQELSQIQKGIDAETREAQFQQQQKANETQAFNNAVITTQAKFYNQVRDIFAENLIKEVTFSPDPKLQNLLAKQQVTTLMQAFEPDGEFARQALTDAGINFDATKAQSLVKATQEASIALEVAKRQVDSEGNQLNKVEYNRAVRMFEENTKAWQDFASDILKQEQQLTSTGTKNALETEVAKEVEKIKLAPKGRPVAKGAQTTAKAVAVIPQYGTKESHEYWAEQELLERSKQARAYT